MEIRKLTSIVTIIGVYLIICPVLFAQDCIFPFLLIDTSPVIEPLHSIVFKYTNLYSLHEKDKPDGYADVFYHKLNSDVKIGNHIYQIGYSKYKLRAKIQALSNETDWIAFSSLKEQVNLSGCWTLSKCQINTSIFLGRNPGFLVGYKTNGQIQFGAGAGVSAGNADIDYNINEIGGSIPFNWYSIDGNCSLQKADDAFRLAYRTIIPALAENGFDNELFINGLSASFVKKIKRDFSILGYANYMHCYADLKYHDEQYAQLDNLHSLYSSLYLRRTIPKRFSVSLGSKIYVSRIGEDSYFDIWPFTYWDMFLAHRTRLKQADVSSLNPFVSFNLDKTLKIGGNPLKINVSLEYNHLYHNENIVVKNRRNVLYPFLFIYDTDYYDLNSGIDGLFVIPLNLSYQNWGMETGISFEQLIPVDWSYFAHHHPSSASTNRDKSRESGGTNVQLFINLPIPELHR